LRLAEDLSADYPHPMVIGSLPLLGVMAGRPEESANRLAAARQLLSATPWLEAIDQLTVTEVIVQHAGDRDPRTYAAIQPGVAAMAAGETAKTVVWLLHAGLAAAWAGQPADGQRCADLLERALDRAAWIRPGVEWLRGLAAEAKGDGKRALAHLQAALEGDLGALPLYEAHLAVDHARVAHLVGHRSAAGESLARAERIYRRLGANGYAARVEDLRRGGEQAAAATATIGLSDRERDVLALVTAGMSYAQIARDLFITQSTVSFHLGKIYAKANVTGRHALIQAVREDPAAFGLPA
jgi:DNA-binding CsgD family transcriptional regulator